MKITIKVSEARENKSYVQATGERDHLMALDFDIGPTAAETLLDELHNKADPVLSWRKSGLYQWAKRKTG